jgi:hypothetical protein
MLWEMVLDPQRAPGFRRMFHPGELALGLFFAIEAYEGDVPTMAGQLELARRAERGGFAALWVRDVPLRDPSFGDIGQIFDPWVWLGVVSAHTREVALATGAIVVPLRHPIDLAKAAASVDNLSGGRLVLGVASGDQRGALLAESLGFARQLLEQQFPADRLTARRRAGRRPAPEAEVRAHPHRRDRPEPADTRLDRGERRRLDHVPAATRAAGPRGGPVARRPGRSTWATGSVGTPSSTCSAGCVTAASTT